MTDTTTKKLQKSRRAYICAMKVLMTVSVVIVAALVIFLIFFVLIKGVPNITLKLVTTSPSYLSGNIGILPDIMNTV